MFPTTGAVEASSFVDHCLYDIFYIEKWGTGIAHMRRLMREHGLAEARLEDLGAFLPSRSTAPANGFWT